MANEKKPSIYDDRGTIGSYDELDEYGVWVKSEPQDLSLAGAEAKETAELPGETFEEFSEDAFDEIPDTDDFDMASDIDDLPDFDDLLEGKSMEDTAAVDDTDDIVVKDDFDMLDIEDTDEEIQTEDEDIDFSDLGNFSDQESDGFEEPDDFEKMEMENLLDLPNELSLDDSDEIALDNDEIALDNDVSGDDDSDDDSEFIEITMEDLIGPIDGDVDLDSSPEDDDVDMSDSLTVELDGDEFPIDEISVDGEIEEYDEPLTASAEQSATDTTGSEVLSTQLLMKIAEELSSIRNELSTLKKDLSSVSAAVPAAPAEEDEKIALTGDELSNILNTSPPPASGAAETEDSFFDKEDDEKIALTGDELSNILNTADFTEEAGADATMEFVEDDEDSLADFSLIDLDENMAADPQEADLEELVSEYSAEQSSIEDEDIVTSEEVSDLDIFSDPLESIESIESIDSIDLTEFPDMDLSLDEVGVSADDEETALDIESPTANEELEEEAFPEFVMDETEELSEIRKTGVSPISYAPEPEDSNYLTEEDPLSIETVDLSEAVIDEPDLSSQLRDNPIEEPSLEDISDDISIDLETEEDISISEDIFTEKDEDFDSDLETFEDDMELTMDLSGMDSFQSDTDSFEEKTPAAFDADSSQSGGDLSLIPEGFIEEADAAESLSTSIDSVELDSMELDSAELYSGEDDDTISMDDIDNFVTGPEETVEDFGEIQDDVSLIPGESSEPAFAAALSDEAKEVAQKPGEIPSHLKKELRTVLSYMDQLLESLPDDKIEEFAKSEYYDTYKKLFKELGLV